MDFITVVIVVIILACTHVIAFGLGELHNLNGYHKSAITEVFTDWQDSIERSYVHELDAWDKHYRSYHAGVYKGEFARERERFLSATDEQEHTGSV